VWAFPCSAQQHPPPFHASHDATARTLPPNQPPPCPADNQWGGGLPNATWIDAATGGRPAMLMRMDSHLALANSAALELAGVGASTPDPAEGIVDRDPLTGLPTGILRCVPACGPQARPSYTPPPSSRARSCLL
jgi:hypothetical protein